MSGLGEERGVALTELLVAMVLMLVITGAALTALTGFERTTRASALRNDAQQRARLAVDRLARELRNQGRATSSSPTGIEKATAYDLVAQGTAAARSSGSANQVNSRRVRYCLAADGRLWTMTQTWTASTPPAAPSTDACPGEEPAWEGKRIIAEHVVNRAGGQERAVFAFDSADPSAIRKVQTALWVDVDPAEAPGETRLRSGVLLRNRNAPPTASFTVTRSGRDASGIRHLILNGSSSDDAEGDGLSYAWYDGASLLADRSAVVDVPVPDGTHVIRLVVGDSDGLTATAETAVVVP